MAEIEWRLESAHVAPSLLQRIVQFSTEFASTTCYFNLIQDLGMQNVRVEFISKLGETDAIALQFLSDLGIKGTPIPYPERSTLIPGCTFLGRHSVHWCMFALQNIDIEDATAQSLKIFRRKQAIDSLRDISTDILKNVISHRRALDNLRRLR